VVALPGIGAAKGDSMGFWYWVFAVAASGFMTTRVNEDGEKVMAFVVTMLAFSVPFFASRQL
jgi:hypothetical protein